MKPGTFTQMYVQLVFAVKNRKAWLDNSIQNQVFEYIGGINTNLKHKSIIINGTSNHIHILFGLHPDVSVSDTVYNIKRGSSLFINKERLCPFNFQWQEGYGAFTYNRSDLDKIYQYIKNQKAHHEQETFMKEYMYLLEKNEIEYKPPYLFEFFDDML